MNDNLENMSPEELEAQKRAEKIRALKENMKANDNSADIPASANSEIKKKKKKKKKTLGRKIRELFPEKEDSIPERIRKLVFLGSIVAIIVCGYLVADYYIDLWNSRRVTNEIRNIYTTYEKREDNDEKIVDGEKYYTMLDSMRKLLDINPDVVAYMKVPGTPIDNPVVKGKDNYEYLHKNFYGQDSIAGTLFMDWRNTFDVVENHRLKEENSDNIIVYGHNMNDESMFGCLKYYERNPDYYSEHPIIEFSSLYEHYKYKIFAFFVVDAYDKSETKYDCWNKLYFAGEDDFYDFVNEARKRSFQLTDVDVKFGDPILTLSTCQYLLGDRSRLIVMARQVRDGEDLYEGTTAVPNTNIKYPSMYYNSRPNEKYDPDAPFDAYGPDRIVKKDNKDKKE